MGPASPGTGVTAGPAVRAMLEAVGVHDVLTKTYGSCNPVNVVRATLNGLLQLRRAERVGELRGVEVTGLAVGNEEQRPGCGRRGGLI